jgi:hypothetical protein
VGEALNPVGEVGDRRREGLETVAQLGDDRVPSPLQRHHRRNQRPADRPVRLGRQTLHEPPTDTLGRSRDGGVLRGQGDTADDAAGADTAEDRAADHRPDDRRGRDGDAYEADHQCALRLHRQRADGIAESAGELLADGLAGLLCLVGRPGKLLLHAFQQAEGRLALADFLEQILVAGPFELGDQALEVVAGLVDVAVEIVRMLAEAADLVASLVGGVTDPLEGPRRVAVAGEDVENQPLSRIGHDASPGRWTVVTGRNGVRCRA